MEKLAENRLPFIITQNGEAKAVLMDVHDYDEKNETIAMLKRLIVSAKEREEQNGKSSSGQSRSEGDGKAGRKSS